MDYSTLHPSTQPSTAYTLKARFSGKTVVASLFAILIFSGKTGFTCQKLREKNFCDSFLFSVRPVLYGLDWPLHLSQFLPSCRTPDVPFRKGDLKLNDTTISNQRLYYRSHNFLEEILKYRGFFTTNSRKRKYGKPQFMLFGPKKCPLYWSYY